MIGRTLSHYEIVDLLGRGGMGAVYRARDTKLNRDVAIKVLPPEFAQDTERVARFEREAQLLASLNHPNIASIYGIEEPDGVKALVLELVEGPTLAERIAESAIPVDEAIAIARQIVDALEAAHADGVIHRRIFFKMESPYPYHRLQRGLDSRRRVDSRSLRRRAPCRAPLPTQAPYAPPRPGLRLRAAAPPFAPHDVTPRLPDGRLLMIDTGQANEIHVVLNWTEELKRLVPMDN